MVRAPDARRVAWSTFVKRAVDHARVSNDWKVADIAAAAGKDAVTGKDRISRSTIFRWMAGDWQTSPDPTQVVAFCDALNIPTSSAFSILWPGKGDRPARTEPLPMDPDFELLLRRLEDPAVPETEKYLIRETVKALAMRVISRRRERGGQDVG